MAARTGYSRAASGVAGFSGWSDVLRVMRGRGVAGENEVEGGGPGGPGFGVGFGVVERRGIVGRGAAGVGDATLEVRSAG